VRAYGLIKVDIERDDQLAAGGKNGDKADIDRCREIDSAPQSSIRAWLVADAILYCGRGSTYSVRPQTRGKEVSRRHQHIKRAMDAG
jgi:hypothetical protein